MHRASLQIVAPGDENRKINVRVCAYTPTQGLNVSSPLKRGLAIRYMRNYCKLKESKHAHDVGTGVTSLPSF